jgi:aconitate hydratase
MGQAPGSGQVSLRTFPRNFPGRSGTVGDQVYLCSPETAAASALFGVVTDPRDLGKIMSWPDVRNPGKYLIDDSSIIQPLPEEQASKVDIITGPNIVPFPDFEALPEDLDVTVAIKVGDNISTDGIMPAGSMVLPLRSNIPAISRFVFNQIDPDFPDRAEKLAGSAVVAGENYGQGSSREHAAIAPRYLGVRIKIAKSFARIHKANLVNFGILPFTFCNPDDYDLLQKGDRVILKDIKNLIIQGAVEVQAQVGDKTVVLCLDLSDRQRRDLVAGGTLNYVRHAKSWEEPHGCL